MAMKSMPGGSFWISTARIDSLNRMIQPYHGPTDVEPAAGERLEAAGRMLGIAVAAVLMIGGLVLCWSIFHTILTVVQQPALLADSQLQWQALLGTEPLVFETPSGTVDLGPILALAIIGLATLVLARLAIQITVTGGRILPLVLGERNAVKRMLRASLEQQSKQAAMPVDGDAAKKSPRLKF
jgi:hypothetical protein